MKITGRVIRRKRNKYNNKITTIGDKTFDSKAEANYYLILVDKKTKGEILDFELQPVFLLQDKFRKNGKGFRKIEYKADFKVIHLDGKEEIIDVKGVKTKEFAIKWKLFEYKYPDLSLTLIEK